MRFALLLLICFSLNALGSEEFSEIACFSDMTDGACQVTEDVGIYQATCILEVSVQYTSGKKRLLVLSGTGSVRKHRVVLFLEAQQKEQAVAVAYSDLYRKIEPFFNIDSCR